jgi:hypothetical protein
MLARGSDEGTTAVAVGVVPVAIGIVTRRAGQKAHASAALAGASQQ